MRTEIEIVDEYVIGVERYPQPKPHHNKGGDCYACTLYATARHFFGDKVSYEQVIEAFYNAETVNGETVLNNTWRGMQLAIYKLQEQDISLEFVIRYPQQEYDLKNWGMCYGYMGMPSGYNLELEAWLKAGYVLITECSVNPPKTIEVGQQLHNDHFLLIDGYRKQWTPRKIGETWSASLDTLLHLVDSSSHNLEWIKTETFTRVHGGGAWIMVRPRCW